MEWGLRWSFPECIYVITSAYSLLSFSHKSAHRSSSTWAIHFQNAHLEGRKQHYCVKLGQKVSSCDDIVGMRHYAGRCAIDTCIFYVHTNRHINNIIHTHTQSHA